MIKVKNCSNKDGHYLGTFSEGPEQLDHVTSKSIAKTIKSRIEKGMVEGNTASAYALHVEEKFSLNDYCHHCGENVSRIILSEIDDKVIPLTSEEVSAEMFSFVSDVGESVKNMVDTAASVTVGSMALRANDLQYGAQQLKAGIMFIRRALLNKHDRY